MLSNLLKRRPRPVFDDEDEPNDRPAKTTVVAAPAPVSAAKRPHEEHEGKQSARAAEAGQAPRRKKTDPASEWHFRSKYGDARNVQLPGGGVFVITNVVETANDSREACVNVLRFRSIEACLLHFISRENATLPSDPAVVERIRLSGIMPTTSRLMIITASNLTYMGESNANFTPTLFVNGHSSCSMQPIPLTTSNACVMFDCDSATMTDILRHYGTEDAETSTVVPFEVVAQIAQNLLTMTDATYEMPRIDSETNLRNNIIVPRCNYGETLVALREQNKLVSAPHRVVRDRLDTLIKRSELDRNYERNTSMSRGAETENCQWNTRTEHVVIDNSHPGGTRFFDEETGKQLTHAEVKQRRQTSEQLNAILEYLAYPLKCICSGFYTAKFKANSRMASDQERSKLVEVINKFLLRVATAEQRKHERKINESAVGIGQRAKAACLEKYRAIEYMSMGQMYRLARLILSEPWKLCVGSLVRREVKIDRNSDWKELTLCELVRVMHVLGMPDLTEEIKAGLALYQMHIQEALNSFSCKDVYLPLQTIMDHAAQYNFVRQTKLALDFLERTGVVVYDTEAEITQIADVKYRTLRQLYNTERNYARKIKMALPKNNAEDETRVMLASVHSTQKTLVDLLLGIKIRGLRRLPIPTYTEHFSAPGRNALAELGFQLDTVQIGILDALCRQDRSIQCMQGLPGAGKSLLILMLLYLAGPDIQAQTCITAVANQAVNNLSDLAARAPFNFPAGRMRFENMTKFYTSVDGEVRAARTRCRLLIIDEFTMADTRLFCEVLRAFPNVQFLMLVGDPNQLGPIQYGFPMRALMSAGEPTHRLEKIYRVSDNARALSENIKAMIDDPLNCFENGRFVYAHCKSLGALREALEFDLGSVLCTPEARAAVQWDAQDVTLRGKKAACWGALDRIDAAAAQHMLVKLSSFVFIERDPGELSPQTPECRTICPLLLLLETHVGATEDNTRIISMLHASCLQVNASCQAHYRRDQITPEVEELRRAVLASSRKKMLGDRMHFGDKYDDEVGEGQEPRDASDPVLLFGKIDSNATKTDRSQLIIFRNDPVRVTENREARDLSSKLTNGDRRTVAFLVDVQYMDYDPRPKHVQDAELEFRARFPDLARSVGSVRGARRIYAPTIEMLREQPMTTWYNACVPHSFAKIPSFQFARFVYFTNGEKAFLNDLRKGSLDHGYAGTVHSWQGAQRQNIITVFAKGDEASPMADRRMAIVALSRARERQFVIGSPEQAKKMACTMEKIPYDVSDLYIARTNARYEKPLARIKARPELCTEKVVRSILSDPEVLCTENGLEVLGKIAAAEAEKSKVVNTIDSYRYKKSGPDAACGPAQDDALTDDMFAEMDRLVQAHMEKLAAAAPTETGHAAAACGGKSDTDRVAETERSVHEIEEISMVDAGFDDDVFAAMDRAVNAHFNKN